MGPDFDIEACFREEIHVSNTGVYWSNLTENLTYFVPNWL